MKTLLMTLATVATLGTAVIATPASAQYHRGWHHGYHHGWHGHRWNHHRWHRHY